MSQGEHFSTAFHSGGVLLSAKRAQERAASIPSEAEAAVILACASLEGFINECDEILLFEPEGSPRYALGQLMRASEDRHSQPIQKLQMLHFGLRQNVLPKGTAILQDVNSLFGLRNQLLHVKPTRIFVNRATKRPVPRERPKCIAHLINQHVIEPDETSGWRHLIRGPKVAAWAYDTGVHARRMTVEWFPDDSRAGKMIRYSTTGLQLSSEYDLEGLDPQLP